MTDVTDADREKAWQVLRQANENDGYTLSDDEARVEAIAAALAEEREKARVPFLAALASIPDDSPELRWVADHIRRAAEETQ